MSEFLDIPEPEIVFSDPIIDAELRKNIDALLCHKKHLSEARRDLRSYLDEIQYDPGSRRGTIEDLQTMDRLNLMLKTNVDLILGYRNHLRATTRGAMLAFPGLELVEALPCDNISYWKQRWISCADSIGWRGVSKRGGMIALTTSPIWSRVSKFGVPYPPFDANCGLGVRSVAKSRCRELGLIA